MNRSKLTAQRLVSKVKKVKKAKFAAPARQDSFSVSADGNIAFEVDNAKQLTVEQTTQLFVPTPRFEQLFSRKNHIILGARGSGKTTWVRMLSHDHLTTKMVASERYARQALEQNYIGVYVPTSVSLIGSLKNKPWQTDSEAEWFFQWRMNLQSCAAFIPVFRSCVYYYQRDPYGRHVAELEIARTLSVAWGRPDTPCTTFEGLVQLLEEIEHKYMTFVAAYRAGHSNDPSSCDIFQTELFYPFKAAVRVLTKVLNIPSTATWMICVDEAEFLTPAHHRILNTHMRTTAGEVFFKIATMPFAHHTLETNTSEPVREGHDFQYISIDQNPIDPAHPGDGDEQSMSEYLRFARKAFAKRASYRVKRGSDVPSLLRILGESPLLDEKSVDTDAKDDEFFRLLTTYANAYVIERARRLRGTSKFRSAILRKMHGALLLKEALAQMKGNSRLEIYCGESMFIRCSDGNARRLVNLFAQILKSIEDAEAKSVPAGTMQMREHPPKSAFPIARRVQNEILESFGRGVFMRLQSEPPVGKELHTILTLVGHRLGDRFRNELLPSDQVTSIEVKATDGPLIQAAVRQAVQLSMLIPSKQVAFSNSSQPCEGVFHIAYVLAPHFHLLPRQNKSVRLMQLLSGSDMAGLYGQQPLAI